jgi:hypothetical protein
LDTRLIDTLSYALTDGVPDCKVRVNELPGNLTIFLFTGPCDDNQRRRILRRARTIVRKFEGAQDCKVKVLIAVGEDHLALESDMLRAIGEVVPSLVEEVICIVTKEGVEAWVRLHEGLDKATWDASRVRVRTAIEKVATRQGLALVSLRVIGWDSPGVTAAVILRSIKVMQPVGTKEIGRWLRLSGYEFQPDRWLQHQVDRLRKEGLVVRSSEGVYCLTPAGLRMAPWGLGRGAPDVQRALGVARRRSWVVEKVARGE